MQHIFGNTFPVREQLKQLGGRWNPARRCWDVADDRADEARRIVAEGPTAQVLFKPPTEGSTPAPTKPPEPPPEPVYIPPPRCLSCGWQMPNFECRRCK